MMKKTIESLPEEIFVNICSFLKSKDLVSIGSTCRNYKKCSEDVSLWRRISKIEVVNFSDGSNEPPSNSEINLAVYLATNKNGEFCIYNLLNI